MSDNTKAYILLVAFLILAFFASGCAHRPAPPPSVVVVGTVGVDPTLLEECPDVLGTLDPNRDYDSVTLVSEVIPAWIATYDRCRRLNHAKLMIMHDAFSLGKSVNVE